MSKTSKIQSTSQRQGAGTIYQIKAELVAAAIVAIFGIIFIAAAMTHSQPTAMGTLPLSDPCVSIPSITFCLFPVLRGNFFLHQLPQTKFRS